jgi:tetratricopeptide (TPR) repeat protein
MAWFRRDRDSFHEDTLLHRWLVEPLRQAFGWLAQLVPSRSDRIGRESVASRFGDLVGGLFNHLLLGPLVFLIVGWASSRQARPFLWGLPAILIAIGATLPSLIFLYVLKGSIRDDYDSKSISAVLDRQINLAELYSQKLFQLAPDNVDFYVRLASTIGDKRQNDDYARDLIEQVAVDSSLRTVNAHLWLAEHYGSRRGEDTPENFARAEEHLKQALAAAPDHFTGNRMSFDLYLRANRPEQAIKYARVIAKADPLNSHLLLQLQKDLGLTAEFEETLANVRLTISEVANRQPNDVRLWNELVACSLQGERYEDAILYTFQGQNMASDPAVKVALGRLASGVLVNWYDKVIDLNDKASLQQAIKSLNWALAVSPSNGDAIRRASELYLDPNFDSKRLDWVVETFDTDPNAYCSHLLIGWRALVADKENGVATARIHWTIANTSSEIAMRILARMAVGIGQLEPAKSEFALQVIDLAMSVSPENLELALGRGFVLAGQERWSEARQQLEAILPLTSDRRITLEKLILCCEKMGDSSAAADFQLQLSRLLPGDVPAE